MPTYLTPDRYRTMNFGADLSAYDDNDVGLAAILARASSLVDAYCNVPLRPQRYSFLGGTVTNEQHPWRIAQTPFESAQRRVYPFHTPVLRCSSFRIYVTQPDPDVQDGQYVLVAPQDLMINRSEDYIEVVSSAMTSTGLFNALIVPAIYLASPICTITYEYGYSFSIAGETLYPIDGQTYQSANNFWTDDAVTVYVNGVAANALDYTVNRTEGTITFASPPVLDAEVTATYRHKLPVEIRDATGHLATHLLAQASTQARGMGDLSRLTMAEISIERATRGDKRDAKSYVWENVPQAAILLDDFSNWRAAI